MIIDYNVSLIDALCGFDFVVKYLDNSYLHVIEENIIHPFSKKIIKNKGINNTGNMIIIFNVIFPKNNLSDEKKKYVRKLLENKNQHKVQIPENSHLCNFSNYTEKTQQQQHQQQQQQESVGCATQ